MWVSELRPGLVLARAVHDVNGRLLMGEGTPLTERFISVLKAWGVAEVAIQGEEARDGASPADAADAQDFAAQAEEIVQLRLSHNSLAHPFVRDVCRLACSRLAAAMARGEVFHKPDVVAPLARADADLTADEAGPPLDAAMLAASHKTLGAMPEVVARLAQVMENPAAFPAELAEVIQGDPGLTARLLKVVNSPLYGFSQRIDTISRAVTIIGVQQLSALALGVTVMGLFRDVPAGALDMRGFWRHSLAAACGSRALASAMGLPNTERYFVAGLLHDVGLLLLLLREPARVAKVIARVRGRGETLCATERRLLGVDHCMVGAALLESWKLPPSLVRAAGCHHEPLMSPDVREAAIVHTADFLAEALVFGSSGQSVLMPLSHAAFNQLGAPQGVACIMFERVETQLDQLETVFMSNGPH